jgi:hypothetical protein
VNTGPFPQEPEESLIKKIYAAVFTVALLAVLGGGCSVWAGQSAIARAEYEAREQARGHPMTEHKSLFRIYHTLGITDWRWQFGIGAALGAAGGIIWLWRSKD